MSHIPCSTDTVPQRKQVSCEQEGLAIDGDSHDLAREWQESATHPLIMMNEAAKGDT